MTSDAVTPLRLLGRHWETPNLRQAGWRET